MKYRKLGRYGVKVSEISLGSWLTYGQAQGKETTQACVKKAFDVGINSIDTADAYGVRHTEPGAAETLLGDILRDYRRSSYVLATKVAFPVGPGPNDVGLSRKHIVEQCELSLRRLKTDYVDILYCHRFEPDTPIDESLRAIDDLIRQGKVLYSGISSWNAEQTREAVDVAREWGLDRVAVNQRKYNMFAREIEMDVMPACELNGIGIAAFSPLAMGILTGKYKGPDDAPAGTRAADPKVRDMVRGGLTEENLSRVETLRSIADELGVKLSQLALAWILAHREVCTAVIGATRPEQVEENVGAVDIELDDETLGRIEAALMTNGRTAA